MTIETLMSDEQKIAILKHRGYRLERHETEKPPHSAVWELWTPTQTVSRGRGIETMLDETETDVWKHTLVHHFAKVDWQQWHFEWLQDGFKELDTHPERWFAALNDVANDLIARTTPPDNGIAESE